MEVALLAAQFDVTLEFFWPRMDGLTDTEYLWEPGPGAWSVRPRAERRTGHSHGRGDWVFEYEPGGPQPAPLRTIAWLMWHVIEMCTNRADWTTGSHSGSSDDIEASPTAAGAMATLRTAFASWRAVFDDLEPAEYAEVGRSQYPGGLDPRLPLRDILYWQNREIIHHCAEMMFLRDLYAHTAG